MLSPLITLSDSTSVRQAPPGAGRFNPVRGPIAWVTMQWDAPTIAVRGRPTGRRARGVAYERKVHGYLKERFGLRYFPSPWFQFLDSGDALRPHRRWCQPDGLLIDLQAGRVVIIEIKYQHTPDAWWQLTHLYRPVLRAYFSSLWDITRCEVVKWFDPSVDFPERPILTHAIEKIEPHEFGVHIWKP